MSKSKPKRKEQDHIFLPSQVAVLGRTFSVTRKKGKFGGHFWLARQAIEWDSTHQEEANDMLLHEIAEIILVHRRHRFHKSASSEQGDLLFVLTHDQFESFIHDLYASLRPFLDFGRLEKRIIET